MEIVKYKLKNFKVVAEYGHLKLSMYIILVCVNMRYTF